MIKPPKRTGEESQLEKPTAAESTTQAPRTNNTALKQFVELKQKVPMD
jgi:hypothetical protein